MLNKNWRMSFLNNGILLFCIVACSYTKHDTVERKSRSSDGETLIYKDGRLRFFQDKYGIKIAYDKNIDYVLCKNLNGIIPDIRFKTVDNKIRKQKGVVVNGSSLFLAFSLKNGYNKGFLFDDGKYQNQYSLEPNGLFFGNDEENEIYYYKKPISINMNAYDQLDSLVIYKLKIDDRRLDSLIVTSEEFDVFVRENTIESDNDVLDIIKVYEKLLNSKR